MSERYTGSAAGADKIVFRGHSVRSFPYAETPAPLTSASFVENGRRPYAVRVVNSKGGDIFFRFNNTDGLKNFGSGHSIGSGSANIEISPISWSGSSAISAGDVIFLYQGDV